MTQRRPVMADDAQRTREMRVVKDFDYSPRLSVVQVFRKGAGTKGMTKAAIERGLSIGAIADIPAVKD